MKFVKLSFVIGAFALFTLACGEATTPTSNQTVNSNTARPTPAVNSTSTANTSPSPVDELAAARTTYNQICTACHGESGDGGNVTIEGKKLKVPSLKKGHALTHTDEQLAKIITNGEAEEGMPAFKDRLKPEEINNMVRFVRREFQGGASKPKDTAPAPKS
ncbi:MAG: cytochrome c [Pyrinomonadaceae bacterium]|nr:cytochrome c [Pyrinomonadaceae bacterium]